MPYINNMNKEEVKIKWYILLFAKWLATKTNTERHHILKELKQPDILALFENEITLPSGAIIYCTECNYLFVTEDFPICQCPYCKKTLNLHQNV